MLEISLLGTFEAKSDGTTIGGLYGRRANRLLALLLLENNRSVHRQWIELALDISYDALRQAESTLRTALGEEKWRLKAINNSLFVDASGIRVDLFEFEQLVEKVDIGSLQRAIKLYRGGLLKDWQGPWINARREELQESYLDALQRAIRATLLSEEFEKAATLLRRFTQAYPLMDYAWAQLIEVYQLTGQHACADETYQDYLAALNARSLEERRTLTPSAKISELMQANDDSQISLARTPTTLPQATGTSLQRAHLQSPAHPPAQFEPVGGAVPLISTYYVVREADDIARRALAPQNSFVLIKGPKQVGKSSLLARLLQQGREHNAQVVYTSWQNTPQSERVNASAFLLGIATKIVDQLGLEVSPHEQFVPLRPATRNFERFLLRQVFPNIKGWIIWGIDEVDRLADCPFKDDVLGMLRSWHNERALDPDSDWKRLTVLLSYATEANLIQNVDQSPFNVGHPVELSDFTGEQVADLNRSYGMPLRNDDELKRLWALVGGHPYLVRRSLLEMVVRNAGIAMVEAEGQLDRGFFRDHLERMRLALQRDPGVATVMHNWLQDGIKPGTDHFDKLCSAGVVVGASASEIRIRCKLYEVHLRRALG